MDLTLKQEEKEVVLDEAAKANLPVLEEMMKAGLFIGRKGSKLHPKMKPLIFGMRNGVSIIDLEETLKYLEKAMDFIKSKAGEKNSILLVGTTPSTQNLVENLAKKLSLPYVIERWLGGTLTNFKTLSKRVSHFKKLKSDKETGRLEKYTKKERLDIDRQIIKMTKMFGGVEEMAVLPKVLFVVDVNANMTAVNEAKILKIPVVGIMNTDTNIELIDYPIPANDRSKSSVEWILGRLEQAVNEGKELSKEIGKVVAK